MTGRNISCLQRAFPGKASTSLLRIMACAIVLSSHFHPGPALAEGCSTPSFAATRSFDAGPNPGTVAVGDFNGDGLVFRQHLRFAGQWGWHVPERRQLQHACDSLVRGGE